MKNKLIFLLIMLTLLVTLAACGESVVTTNNAETTAPAITSAAPATTTKTPIVTTTVPETTTVKAPLEGKTAEEIVDYAMEKMAAQKGFEALVIGDELFNGEATQTEMTAKINLSSGKKGFISAKLDEDGGKMDMTYIDGVVYCAMKMTGMEVKYKTTDESMTGVFDEMFSILEKEDDATEDSKIASIRLISFEDGIYKIEVVATKEAAFESIVTDYEGFDIDDVTCSMIEIYEINASGDLISVVTEIDYSHDVTNIKTVTTITFNSTGELPEITIPADVDDYMNMDEMQ